MGPAFLLGHGPFFGPRPGAIFHLHGSEMKSRKIRSIMDFSIFKISDRGFKAQL
jgi:hypothetical protein